MIVIAGSPWELPPRVPTDPDLPNSGIRLVKSWIRHREGSRVDHPRRWQRIPRQQPVDHVPRQWPGTSPCQPFPPPPHDLVTQPLQRRAVARDAVVGVVAPQLLTQMLVLLRNRIVSVNPTPLSDLPHHPAEPTRCRLPTHHPVPLPRPRPHVPKPQKLERLRRLRFRTHGRRAIRRPLEAHQPRLLRMKRQTERPESFRQYLQHPPRVRFTGEAHDEIVRIANEKGTSR